MKSAALGISIGRSVDVALYDATSQLAWSRMSRHPSLPRLFAAAWNGVGYRAACSEQHADAIRRLLRSEPSATPSVRLAQERELFGLVLNIAAAEEAMAYSALVARMYLDNRAVTPRALKQQLADTLSDLQAAPQTSLIGHFIEDAHEDESCRLLRDVRDVLVHRGVLLRSHWVGGQHDGTVTVARNPKAAPLDWQPDVTLSAALIDSWSEWLDAYLGWGMPLLYDVLDNLPIQHT